VTENGPIFEQIDDLDANFSVILLEEQMVSG